MSRTRAAQGGRGGIYGVFLERVAAARGMSTARSGRYRQGRVFTGRQALAAGLVDELGGLEDAIRIAAMEAGFPEGAATRPLAPGTADACGGNRSRVPIRGTARTFPASRCGAPRHPPGDSSLRPEFR